MKLPAHVEKLSSELANKRESYYGPDQGGYYTVTSHQEKHAFKKGFTSGYTLARDEAKGLVEALNNLSRRHAWMPNMGECMCQEHRIAYDVVAKYRDGEKE